MKSSYALALFAGAVGALDTCAVAGTEFHGHASAFPSTSANAFTFPTTIPTTTYSHGHTHKSHINNGHTHGYGHGHSSHGSHGHSHGSHGHGHHGSHGSHGSHGKYVGHGTHVHHVVNGSKPNHGSHGSYGSHDKYDKQNAYTPNLRTLGYQMRALQLEIAALETAATLETSAAMIEDYFSVNDTAITPTTGSGILLGDIEFCVEAPTVLEFEMAVTFDTNVDDITLSLNINDVVVAKTFLDDEDGPTNAYLFYRGQIMTASEVWVSIDSSGSSVTVPVNNLQWGYKLYGSGYPIIHYTDTACISS